MVEQLYICKAITPDQVFDIIKYSCIKFHDYMLLVSPPTPQGGGRVINV
jgi:hypothetical protein